MGVPQAEERYVSYREAADMLGLTYDAVVGAVRSGRLHAVKFPGDAHKYISVAQVEAYRDKRPWAPNRPIEAPEVRGRAAIELDSRALRERVAALSGPTIEAWRETVSALSNIAVAAAISVTGAGADPKRQTG